MKLNKLEEQIFLAISEHPFHTNLDRARIAAKIALELAEKAYYEGRYAGREDAYYNYQLGGAKAFDRFKQEIL